MTHWKETTKSHRSWTAICSQTESICVQKTRKSLRMQLSSCILSLNQNNLKWSADEDPISDLKGKGTGTPQ